jgi:signal transduction histidine kinase
MGGIRKRNRLTSLVITFLRNAAYFIYKKCILPHSAHEDSRRKELILNVLLICISLFFTTLTITVLCNSLRLMEAYTGIPLLLSSGILLVFGLLLLASRMGYYSPVSYFLLGTYFLATAYGAYTWGVDLPSVLLSFALLIVMSSILIGIRFALLVTGVIVVLVLILGILESSVTRGESHWRLQPFVFDDAIEYIAYLFVIMAISWLSNREMEKTLKRARHSEETLMKERDTLEIKVEERTRELKQAQREKMTQLYRFAEFGRLSSGLFHDLMNPLTVMSLNMEKLQKNTSKETSVVNEPLQKAINASKKIEHFIGTVRKQVQMQGTECVFSINEEIEQAIELLTHKARHAGVTLHFNNPFIFQTYGNPIKLHQTVVNLLSNAIDSYDNSPLKTRPVMLTIAAQNSMIILEVSDKGSGIPETILSKIFDPFFTTKTYYKGIGLGLSTTKEVVEKYLHGTIAVTSKAGEGSTFAITFPIRTLDNHDNNS